MREPAVLIIAQVTEAEVCGEGPEARWLCQLVFRSTENDLLARGAGGIATVLVVLAIVVGAGVVAWLLGRFVSRFGMRMERRIEERLVRAQHLGAITDATRYRDRRLQRVKAVTGVMRGVIATVVWIAAILWVIAELGFRLQPILAGAGLVGIVIGFGAQQLVRDVLAGIAMLVEDQYGVGDWIEVDGVYGIVERVGLRSTAFRDIDGTVHHVLNGYIQRVGNLSKEWARATYDVPVALDADIPAMKALIHKVATDLAEDPVWGEDIIGPAELWGVQEFGPDGVLIRVSLPTRPLRNWDVKRQLRERLKFAFDRANVRMPSRLIELGGQRVGYPFLTHEVEEEAPRPPRHRGLVPEGVGPLDRPPVRQPSVSDEDATLVVPEEEPSAEDHTTELRIEQGPRPRPD